MSRHCYLEEIASLAEYYLPDLQRDLIEVRAMLRKEQKEHWIERLFYELGSAVEKVELFEEKDHDASVFYPIREKSLELVKAFCEEWKEEYFEKARAGLNERVERYNSMVNEREELIKNGTLAEGSFNYNSRAFDERGSIELEFIGIRAASYVKEMDLQRYESKVAEIDKRLRNLIPKFAEAYANLDPEILTHYLLIYLKSWWWQEVHHFYTIYREKLPSGTPDRDRWFPFEPYEED